MSIKCCGVQRSTKYCSDCGKRLFHKPIEELLNHLEIQVKCLETRTKNNKISSNSKALVKWKSWYSALQDLLK